MEVNQVDIRTACDDLVTFVNEVKKSHYDKMGYELGLREKIVWERLSSKWVKLIVQDNGGKDRSVYGFVALQDFETKGLGQVKFGDIHKAATWSAPAKHARGNVFNKESWSCCGPYGMAYLRG
jgi:hypothetical protein